MDTLEIKDRNAAAKRKSAFTAGDLLPATGEPDERFDAATSAAVASAITAFNTIYVPTRAHDRAIAAFDCLRLVGLGSPGRRKQGLRMLAPSASGKTTAAAVYKARVEAAANDSNRYVVVIVPLEAAITVRRMWIAVCRAYGDPHCSRGTEQQLRQRAYRYIAEHRTQLLVFDEIQHLAPRGKDGLAVSDALKCALDDGIAPLVLVGTVEARTMLTKNPQLSNRLTTSCDIVPLDASSSRDRGDFARFLRLFDEALVAKRLLPEPSCLNETLTAACLFELSAGTYGQVVNLLRVALAIAIRRSATRIEVCDLSDATLTWAIDQGLASRDPFRAGVRG